MLLKVIQSIFLAIYCDNEQYVMLSLPMRNKSQKKLKKGRKFKIPQGNSLY